MIKGYVTDNCANRRAVDISEYSAKAKSHAYDILLDDRHQIFSENNTCDMVEYLNYIDTIREIAQEDTTSGRYRYMLDLGFIPVSMPPVWLISLVYSKVRPVLDAKGIEYYQLPASSFSSGSYTASQPDIWVNKMSVYEMCNCKPESVTVRRLLEVLGVC